VSAARCDVCGSGINEREFRNGHTLCAACEDANAAAAAAEQAALDGDGSWDGE